MSGEMNINDFLDKLGKETITRINKEKKAFEKPNTAVNNFTPNIKEGAEVKGNRNERPVTPKPIAHPPAQKPSPVITKNEDHLLEEETSRALKFGSVMIDTIQKTFDSEKGRRMAYESIRNAINMILGEQTWSPQRRVADSTPVHMSEAEYDSMPRIQESQPPVVQPRAKQVNEAYQGDLGIRSDGNTVDLSRVTEASINEFRELAGLTD